MVVWTLLLHLAHSSLSFASFPEMYGASSSTIGIGSQARVSHDDPSNNYYAPALLGFSQNLAMQASTFWVDTDFKDIGTITVENDWTRATGSYPDGKSTVEVNREPLWMNAIHLSVPLISSNGPKLGISAFVPAKSIMEVRTGDPLLPEYVMYNGRNTRTQIFANLAYAFNPDFAVSLGVFNGFQVAMDLYTYARVGSDKQSYSSFAHSDAVAQPTLAGVGSVAYKRNWWGTYFTIVQEMKSKLSGKASGSSDDPSIPFAIQLNSLAFYDPLTLRAGWQAHSEVFSLSTSVEWQKWDHYQSPVAHLKQEGGAIVSSKLMEQLDLQNIFVPKVGVEWMPTDALIFSLGGSYRPSPLKESFAGPGNSIDTDKYIASAGSTLKFKIWEHEFEGSAGVQWHQMKDRQVNKSANREDGGAGLKVGAPGYKVGGKIIVGSMGLLAKF